MSTCALLLFNLAREFVTDSLISCYYAAFGQFILGVRQRPKRVALACAVNILCHILSRHFIYITSFSYLLTALDLFIVCRILWAPRRGIRFFLPFLVGTVSAILNELILSGVYILIYPQAGTSIEIAGRAQYALQPYTYPVLFALTIGQMGALLCLMYWVQRLARYMRRHASGFTRALRLGLVAALILAVLTAFGLELDCLLVGHTDVPLRFDAIREDLLPYALYFVSTLLLCFYAWLDIRQFALSHENRSLGEKNMAYQHILNSTREYRHNMANLLYGLEGVILTRDTAQIEAYYAQMARRCARINNENAAAINRLKAPSLAALLLRKLDDAEKLNVSFYLSVSEAFTFDDLPSAALCEVLGNLIDNALNAATRSETPRVDMTMDNASQYDEIIIANTYHETADLSFLSGTPKSEKLGRKATGLVSVHGILKKYPDVCFSQFIRGRYVETSICAYKR